jgi:signal transduction histidine kinase/DNA-binding NarL/FixJ family response regulator
MRILLVEDNPGDARLVKEFLAEIGTSPVELTHVERLSEAREALARGRVDLLLLDLELPDSSGLATLTSLAPATAEVPVVVLTGMEDGDVAVEALRLGAQDYLVKQHLDPADLERSIRYAAERKRLQREEQLLGALSRRLGTTNEFREMLHRFGELLVERLADVVWFDSEDETGQLHRLHVAHADPADADLAADLLHFPLDRAAPHLMRSVIETTQPLLLPEVTDDVLAPLAQSQEHLRLMRRLNARSIMAVPLVAGDRLLGAVGMATRRRAYTAHDLESAGRLASAAAPELEKARTYESLQAALRARDRVLGVVAHDLRNPLNTIVMATELLLEDTLPEAQRLRQLNIIRRTGARMNRLIQDLLDVARMEDGRMTLDLALHDPSALAREAVELNAAQAESIGSTIEVEVEGRPGPVRVDRDRILRVLSNLIGNAIKHAAGTRIRVRVLRHEVGVGFQVQDQGPGIAPDLLPNLFTPFWQARRSDSQGAGLGLAISRGIVEAHGGRIWADSEVGSGTTLSFVLPSTGSRRRGDAPA